MTITILAFIPPLLARLFHPDTFYDGAAPADLGLRLLFALIALAVVGVSWWRLGRRPRRRPLERALEVGVAVAAAPLMLSLAHSFHLVLLLLPILVLLHLGFVRGDRRALTAAVVAWLLVEPGSRRDAVGDRVRFRQRPGPPGLEREPARRGPGPLGGLSGRAVAGPGGELRRGNSPGLNLDRHPVRGPP